MSSRWRINRAVRNLEGAMALQDAGTGGAIEGLARRINVLESCLKESMEALEEALLLSDALAELIVDRELATREEIGDYIDQVVQQREEERLEAERRAEEEERNRKAARERAREELPRIRCASCGMEVPKQESYYSELGEVCRDCSL